MAAVAPAPKEQWDSFEAMAREITKNFDFFVERLKPDPKREMMFRFRVFRSFIQRLNLDDVAARLGWTISKVEKFESAKYNDVKYLELIAYLTAIGVPPIAIQVVDKTGKVVADLI